MKKSFITSGPGQMQKRLHSLCDRQWYEIKGLESKLIVPCTCTSLHFSGFKAKYVLAV